MNETCDTMWMIKKNNQIIMMKMCIGMNTPNLFIENATIPNMTNITNMTTYIHNNLTNSSNITLLSPSPILVPSFSIEVPSPSQLHTPSSSKTSSNYIRGIDYTEPSSSFIDIVKENETLTNTPNKSLIPDNNNVLYIVSISMSTLVLVILLIIYLKRRKNNKVHTCRPSSESNYKKHHKNTDKSNKRLPRDYIIEYLGDTDQKNTNRV